MLHKTNKLAKLFITNPDHVMGFGHSQLGLTAAPFAAGANQTKINETEGNPRIIC